MNYLFRMPRFPLLLDAGEQLVAAKSRAQLEAKVLQLALCGEERFDIVDANAEGFALYAARQIVAPHIGRRRWNKVQIIDLYNGRRPTGQPELGKKSLGNRSLEQVVKEVVQLLSQRQ